MRHAGVSQDFQEDRAWMTQFNRDANLATAAVTASILWIDSNGLRAQEHVGNSLRAIGLGSLTASWRKRRDWAMANPFLKLVAIGNYGRSDLEDRFA